MTRPEEFTVYQATDPGTPPEVLEQMAGARPDLRQFVAGNPATTPEVLAWLGGLGEPAVAAALARRSAAAGPWAAPAQPAPSGPGAAYPPPGQPPAPAPDPYAAGQGVPGPYAPPSPAASGPYAPPSPAAPYPGATPATDPYAAYAQGNPYAPPPVGDVAAAGYGYQPQPAGNRTGPVVAIAVGAVVLIAALIFAATQIFGAIGGTDFGDDADLDQLWNECSAGDADACDDLYWESPIGSEYEEFGDTCGNRQPVGTGNWCRDVM